MMTSFLKNENLHVNRYTFIIIIITAFAIMFIFSIHSWNKGNEPIYRVVQLTKNTTIIYPQSSAVHRKSAINSQDIDEQRKLIRLKQRFNLMEEVYGSNWTEDTPQSSTNKCNIGN